MIQITPDVLTHLRLKSNKENKYAHVACFTTNYKHFDIDNICSIGTNSNKSRFNNKYITTHAEIQAYENLKYKMSRYEGKLNKNKRKTMDLISIRFLKTGELSDSAPCLHCSIELNKNKIVKINNLIYSTSSGTIVKIKFDDYINSCHKCISKGRQRVQVHCNNN